MKKGFFITTTFYLATSSCILPSPLTLQLILEFAKWRSWDQLVLFENLTSLDCVFAYTRPLMACFAEEGISVSIQSAVSPNVPDALVIQKHRIGSIVLLDGLNLTSPENVLHVVRNTWTIIINVFNSGTNILVTFVNYTTCYTVTITVTISAILPISEVVTVASQKFLFNYYISWLMITTRNNDATIDTVLRHLNIGIDSDVVVATPSSFYSEIEELPGRTCSFLQRYGEHFEFHEPPMKRFDENALINLNYAILENRTVFFYFVHVYKIRYADNTSLVTNFLGSWNSDSWSFRNPISVKLRNDFKGLPIVFGVLNGTIDGEMDTTEEETDDIAPLLDFASFVTSSVNASIELVPHEKLGTLNNKVWNNLLGDVVTGTVDIGLGYITVNEERQTEMTFSHPLIRYMRNIYYHPLEIGTMRDIFRQPFNNYLLGCVASTYIVILIVMGLIIYAAKNVLHYEEEKHIGIGEAALWCISIMCMQGSLWIPRNPSGKTVLLFSLIFSLVTYNAYAGFITSILSVQASGIRSITDILSHNFKLGYSRTDDEYIRNVNDSNLRELYIRAFNNRESRLDTTSGLAKAVKGYYGFFVSATLARRALRSTLIQERCSLRELPLPQTFTMVALPMANSCPYKKVINLNILKIRERGVLNRITERMLPEMPRCKLPTTFHSARLTDVYSAFFILIAGGISAVSIWIIERLWNKRRQMKDTIVRGMRQHHLMPNFSHFPHLPHLPRFPYFSHFPHLPQLHPRGEFSKKHDPTKRSDTFFASNLSISVQESPATRKSPSRSAKEEDEEIHSEEGTNYPRFERGLRDWRKETGSKRVDWTSSSGLKKKKFRKGSKDDGNNDDTIFPFYQ